MYRLVACLVVAVLGGWSSGRVRAQARPLSIVWQAEGDSPCTKPIGAEAEVERLASTPAATPTSFAVRCVTLPDGRYLSEVRVEGNQTTSQRVLASCEEAREATLLLMAMALSPEPEPEPEPASTAPASADRHWSLSAAVLVDHPTLPRTAFGVALGVGFTRRLLRLGLTGRYLPAQAAPDLPRGVEAHIDWFTGAWSVAAVWRFGMLGVGPRVELELGALRGRARGVEESHPVSAFWIASSAGVELELWFHARVAAQFVAAVGTPFTRPRFAFADETPFHTVAPYFVRGALGLTFRIDPTETASTGH